MKLGRLGLCGLALLLTAGKPRPADRVSRWEVEVMADSRWVSTTGDLNAAASYAPSGVPGVNNTIFFDGTSQQDVNLNVGALSAVNSTKVWIQSPYSGNIGADGAPLVMPIRRLIHNGSGSLYYDGTSIHPSGATFVIDSPNQQDAFTLTAGGGYTNWSLFLINGGARIADGVASGIYVLDIGSSSRIYQPIVDIGSGMGAIASYHQTSGIVTTKSSLSTANSDRIVIDGGLLIVDSIVTAAWDYLIVAGGTVQYNGTGTLARCHILSGTLDMSQDSRAKTITELRIMPGANFITHDNVTVTSMTDLRRTVPVLP